MGTLSQRLQPRRSGNRAPVLTSDAMGVAAIVVDLSEALAVAGWSDVATEQCRDRVSGIVAAANIVSLNEAACSLLGWQEPAVGTMTLSAIWPDAARDALCGLLEAMRSPQRAERHMGRLRTFDGELVPVVFTVRQVDGDDAPGRLLVQCTDMRGLDLADEAMPDAVAKQRTLFRNLPLGLCRVNGDGLTRLYAELGVGPDTDLLSLLRSCPDVRERAAAACIIEDVNPEAVRILGAASGAELLGRSVAFAWRARPDSFIQTLIAGMESRSYECETNLTRLDGGTLDVILASASVRESGSRISIIGMVDIADRIAAQADLIRLQAQFAQSYRLSLLSELCTWFAHEISQPLSAIAASASTGHRWLKQAEPRIGEARRAFDRISSATARSQGIIERLRCMAQSHAPALNPEPLREVVSDALKLIEGEAKAAHVAIALEVEGTHDIVLIDRAQIGQVVVNLIVNAIEALERSQAAERSVIVSLMAIDGCARCTVSDSGPGLAQADVASLFAAQEAGSAGRTGFGLTMSRSIVAMHGGSMDIEASRSLSGASVWFQLPVVPASSH